MHPVLLALLLAILTRPVAAVDLIVTGTSNLPAGSYVYDNVWVQPGATLTISGGVYLAVANNFIVDPTGMVNGDFSGDAGGAAGPGPTNGAGTGGGYSGCDIPGDGGGGAGHGAMGGTGGQVNFCDGNPGIPYDDPFGPVEAGSGGGGGGTYAGGAGGGALSVNAGGTATLNGSITMNGQNGFGNLSPSFAGGAGSGGSIYVQAPNINGTGSLSARGGIGGQASGGGGGGGGGAGGLINLCAAASFNYAGSYLVAGGAGGYNGTAGGAGQVHFCAATTPVPTLTSSSTPTVTSSITLTSTPTFTPTLTRTPTPTPSPTPPPASLGAWQYYLPLTVNNTSGSALTDFAVLVSCGLPGSFYTASRTDGADLRFTDASGTVLYDFQLVSFNRGGNSMEAWVKVPNLSAGTNTLRLYYGNALAVAYASGPVFPSAVGVWHFAEGTGNNFNDSSGAGNNGGFSGGPTWTTGIAGGGVNFTGSLRGQVPASGTIDVLNNAFTISCWAKPSATGIQYLVSREQSGTNRYGVYLGSNTAIISVNGVVRNSGLDLGVGAWHMVTGTFNGTTEAIYRDGANGGSSTTSIPPSTTNPLIIGAADGAGANGFNGQIDEVRVYPGVRSFAEISADYVNQNCSWISVGAPVALFTVTPTPSASPTRTPSATPTSVPLGAVFGFWSYQGGNYFNLDDVGKRADFRWPQRGSKKLDQVNVYVQLNGPPPAYRYAIYADANGQASGSPLASVVTGATAGWNSIAIGSLSVADGEVYHLVIEPDAIAPDPTHSLSVLYSFGQRVWTIDQVADPILAGGADSGFGSAYANGPVVGLHYDDGSVDGTSLQTYSSGVPYGLIQVGQTFNAPAGGAWVSRLGMLVQKLGAPPADLQYSLYDVTGATLLSSGSYATAASVSSGWLDRDLSSAVFLVGGNQYRLAFSCPSCDGSNTYALTAGFTGGGSTSLHDYTYGGANSSFVSSTDGGASFPPDGGQDLYFRFNQGLVPTPTATPTRTSSPSPSPSPTACGCNVPVGKQSVGVFSQDLGSYIHTNRWAFPSTDNYTLYDVKVNVKVAPGGRIRAAIYMAAGMNHSFIAQTDAQTAVIGWNTLALPSFPLVSGFNSILIALMTETGVEVAYDTGATAMEHQISASTYSFGAFPTGVLSTDLGGNPNYYSAYVDACPDVCLIPTDTPTLTGTPTATATVTPSPTVTQTWCTGLVSFDSFSTVALSNTAEASLTHNVGAGLNPAVVVMVMSRHSGTISAISYAGQPMTLVRKDIVSPSQVSERQGSLYILAPAPSGPGLLSVTSTAANDIVLAVHSYFGVDPFTPVGDHAGYAAIDTNANYSLNVAQAGAMIVDHFMVQHWAVPSLTVTPTETVRWNFYYAGAGTSVPGAGDLSAASPGLYFMSHNWTGISATDVYAQGLVLVPAYCSGMTATILPTFSRTPSASPTVTASPSATASPTTTRTPVAKVLFVVGNPVLSLSDQAQVDRLENVLGYGVTVIDDDLATAGDASAQDLVLVSETVISSTVAGTFKSVLKPVIACDDGIFDNMDMIGGVAGTDYGSLSPQAQVYILDPAHYLADGNSNTVTVASSGKTLVWGRPEPSASKIASLVDDPSKVVEFAYEAGVVMANGFVAPARRLGFFMGAGVANVATAAGWGLFDRAIQWTLSAVPTATPTVTSTASGTASPSATPSASPTQTPSASPTASPSATPSGTPSATPSITHTVTPLPLCVWANGEDADLVLGQPNFTTKTANNGGLSASSMSIPSALLVMNGKLLVADYGNNRVLIYNSPPTSVNAPADLVIGQPNFTSNGPGNGAAQLSNPMGLATDGTRLFISDYGNHRVLIYNSLPGVSGASANMLIGQSSFNVGSVNGGGGVSSVSLNQPAGLAAAGGKLFIVDRGNHRVLIFNSIPASVGTPADVVLGQPAFNTAAANNGGLSAASLNLPYGVASDGSSLQVSDSGNNRILHFDSIPGTSFTAADKVIGQTAFNTGGSGTSASQLVSPLGLQRHNDGLLVADRNNNRVLYFDPLPVANGQSAGLVLGQGDFITFNADRGTSVGPAGFNGPQSIAVAGTTLYVADFNNARVLGFDCSFVATTTPTPSATPTASPTVTETASPTATPSASPSATPTASPSATPSASPSATPSASPSATPSVSPSATPSASPSPSSSPSASPSITATASPSASPSPSGTPTASPSGTPTVTPSPTAPILAMINPASGSTAGGEAITLTGVNFSLSATVYFGVSPAAIVTPGTTVIMVIAPAGTSGTVQVKVTNPGGVDSNTLTYTYLLATPTFTATPSATGTSSLTESPSPSRTASATQTASPTSSATGTPTVSPTQSRTASPSATQTNSPSPAASLTASPTATSSQTPIPSATETLVLSATPTPSITVTWTETMTPQPTNTPEAPAVLSRNLWHPAVGPLHISIKAPKPGRVVVHVFNLAPELVRTPFEADVPANQTFDAIWDGKNESGESCGAGVYIVSVQGAGISKTLKVVLMK